jgi:hypothetical protein
VEKPKVDWERTYIENLSMALADREVEYRLGTNAHDDFHFMRAFGTIVASNSSFAWWAAFLSEAKKIYTFEKWLQNSPLVKLQYAKGMTAVGGKYIWEV